MAKLLLNPKVIFGAATGGVLCFTKPTEQSFDPFFRKHVGIQFKKERPDAQLWEIQLVTEGIMLVTTRQVKDWVFFKTSSVHLTKPDTDVNFVGVFNGWYELPNMEQNTKNTK